MYTFANFCERGTPLWVGPNLGGGLHVYDATIDEVKLFRGLLSAAAVCEQAGGRFVEQSCSAQP